ncbi:RNA polymerase sigma factor [Sphingobium aquiterrae]|uniref:RNA polymerase sigma factor n=1 Tax=Sphingobium aquiterrae TaxID=2038656 RepID=UPI00301695F7
MSTNSVALTRLLLRERPLLMRLAQRILGNATAAEDVTQKLWLRVQRIEDDPPIVNKRAYLFRLTANLATDEARAERRREALFEMGDLPDDVADDQPFAETRMVDQERLRQLEAALAELPLRCRQVFTLRRIDGLPPDEVARRLGITLNAVAKHVRIALRHCHERMNEDFGA